MPQKASKLVRQAMEGRQECLPIPNRKKSSKLRFLSRLPIGIRGAGSNEFTFPEEGLVEVGEEAEEVLKELAIQSLQ